MTRIQSKNSQKTKKSTTASPNVTSFGERQISKNNTTNSITLPRVALENCGKMRKFKVELISDKTGKKILLSPVKGAKK